MPINNHQTLVMKFGGTSVGSTQALEQVCAIVQAQKKTWQKLVIVTSAFSGVTDLLMESALKAAQRQISDLPHRVHRLRQKHDEAINAFISSPDANLQVKQAVYSLVDQFQSFCQAIHTLGEVTPRALDSVSGLGERMSVRVLSAILQERGIQAQFVEASDLIVTDNNYQSATPVMEKTCEKTQNRLLPLLEKQVIPVVTGFIAASEEGIPTTLGRGGSDYTAAILGVALQADEVWIWTDVNGVMTADPRIVPEAQTLAEISYQEVSELAYFGAKVLHPKTIRPVIEAGIGLRVLNTFNPQNAGTWLTPQPNISAADPVIKAVAAFRGIQLITVEGRGMLGVPGVAARIFKSVASTGSTVPLVTEASSEQSICFAVPIAFTGQVLQGLQITMAEELRKNNIDQIWASPEVVIVTAVCPNIKNKAGVAAKVFTALATHDINVLAIAQGSSQVAISLVISVADLETTIKALHPLTITPNHTPARKKGNIT